ncbi:MAG: hypothetical protein AAGG46_05415, partial [Planctomycetota bacterium]
AVAWPLVTASAGVERPDPFDAFSRGVAYAYQRPLRLVVYLAQGWLVGIASGIAVELFVRSILQVASAGLAAPPDELTGAAAFLWVEVTRLPMVYYAAYFWCGVTAIYLLLRRDIDEQQADEVFLEAASEHETAGEPQLPGEPQPSVETDQPAEQRAKTAAADR